MQLEFLFQSVLRGCSAQDDIVDNEKVVRGSALIWTSGFPSDFLAIQINGLTPLDSVGERVAMVSCVHNIKKRKYEITVLGTKKLCRIAATPTWQLGKFVIIGVA